MKWIKKLLGYKCDDNPSINRDEVKIKSMTNLYKSEDSHLIGTTISVANENIAIRLGAAADNISIGKTEDES